MSKGSPALAPTTKLRVTALTGSGPGPSGAYSLESVFAALNKISQFQEEETPDGTYSAVPCLMDNPFSTCTWEFVLLTVVGVVQYDLTIDSEEISTITTIGRPALASRRKILIEITLNAFTYTVRSIQAAVNQIVKFEDLVASTGDGAAGDIAGADIPCNGTTPFETYTWNFEKDGISYTLVPTATS